MSEEKIYQYDAFISYRHSEPDRLVAEKLHRMLETYRIPGSIAKRLGKKRINRVFRDRDELPTSSDLANNISLALESSAYLIVICSPRTPQSQWVTKEIETFAALHGHDKILALLIEGEPDEAFPHELRFIKRKEILPDGSEDEYTIEVEPLAADIRAGSTKEMFKKLKVEILRLLAPMFICRFDDLRQRHRERLIRNILTASISLSAFFLAFGSFSTYQALIINQKSLEVMQKSREVEQKNQEVIAQIKETQISQSRYLADISNQLYAEGDRYRAILAAQEALPKDLANPERPYVPEAEFALSQALHVYDADDTPDMDIVLDHNQDVLFLQMSPDGKTILTASTDGILYTWDAESGKKLAAINVGDISIFDYQALFIDDASIVTTTEDTTSCFDIQGNLKWAIEEYSYKMALSQDCKKLACDFNDHVGIIDTATGKLLLDILPDEKIDFTGNGILINSLAFNKTSDLLAVGINNGTVYIIDTATDSLNRTLQAGYSNINSLEFSNEGTLIVSSHEFDQDNLVFGKGKGSLKVFLPQASEPSMSLDYPDSSIEKAAFHAFNPSWIVLVESEKLHVVDYKTGETVYTFIHGDKVTAYKVFDTFILSSSSDGTVRFWMTQNVGYEYDFSRMTFNSPIEQMVHGKGKFAVCYPSSSKVYVMKYLENDQIIRLEGHNDYIGTGAFSSNGKMALTCDMDSDEDPEKGLICLWDTENKQLLRKQALGEAIKEAKFVDNDSKIFIQLKSNKIMLLSTSDLSIAAEYQINDYISTVKYDPEMSKAAISTYGEVIIFSLEDLKIVNRFDEMAVTMEISADSLLLADSTGIRLFDYLSGSEKASLEDDTICGSAISNDGTKVALAYEDKSIKLVTAGTSLNVALTIKDSKLNISRLIFSDDAKTLFVGYEDNSIAFYDANTGVLLNTQNGEYFSSPLEKVVFSRDGSRFICTDNTGRALLFDAVSLKILASASLLDIDPEFKTILSRYDYYVLFMPVYSTQMLLDEAKEQLNGRTLTPDERKTMFIDS